MMDWITPYQPRRDQYWPEIERFFGHLPPQLFRQAVLLQNNLATRYSETGQFRDILARRHDHPLLYLPFWLLDDFQAPLTPSRRELEKRLLLASVFSFAAEHLHNRMLDQDNLTDLHHILLTQALTQQVTFQLAQLFPADSPFWSYQQACWADYAEAVLGSEEAKRRRGEEAKRRRSEEARKRGDAEEAKKRRSEEAKKRGDTEARYIARKLAPAKIPVAAVAISAGQTAILPQLFTLMDHLNAVLQLRQDILAIRRDLKRGHYTYPVLRTMAAAGIDWQQPVVPERVLGALILTGVGGQLCQEGLAWLEESRAISQQLNLPTFAAYLTGVEEGVRELHSLFSIRAKPARVSQDTTRPKQPHISFLLPIDTPAKVIDMAEGYLLADLTFRESWEIQRQGLFGLPELIGRVFPAGLIVELLSRYGHPLPAQVNEIFDRLQATDFCYYDPPLVPPDADVLGLALRLFTYSPQPALHRQWLQQPLNRLPDHVLESGEIPVWFTPNSAPPAEEHPPVLLWGHSCATVEASLLLGLLEYDGTGYQDLIQKSALNLLDRLSTTGLGATRHYVPLYSLWILFELMVKLSNQNFVRLQPEKFNQVVEMLTRRLDLEARRPTLTPQDAALLTLAYLAHQQLNQQPHAHQLPSRPQPPTPNLQPSTFNLQPSTLLPILYKSQRYDGSWPGEPLFICPHRYEEATWYASNSVTTALCYHALKTYCHLF